MKIFNSLFSPSYGYVRSIAGIVLGVAMLIWPDVAQKTIVQVIGCFMIAVGTISFILSFKKSKEKEKQPVDILGINGIFDVILGVILVLVPDVFVVFLMFILGLLLCVLGVGHIISLCVAKKISTVSYLYFILPILTTVCGIILIFKPFEATTTLFIVFGAALVIYGVSELFSTIKLSKVNKVKRSYEYRVEDAKYEEVKDKQ